MSNEASPSPLCSLVAVLNPPSNLPGRLHQAFQVAGNVPDWGQPFKFSGLGMGPTPVLRPFMTSPTPSHIYKGPQRPGRPEYSLPLSSTQPPSPVLWVSAGMLTLREVFSIMPQQLLPSYPRIGHHLPPSSLAVNFRCAPSPDPANRSPLWPSKGAVCHCLW